MARRHAELVRRYGEPMTVSTVAHAAARAPDAEAQFRIDRQDFAASKAKLFANEIRWARWLAQRCATGIDVIHCGEIRPVGYAVWWAHKRTQVPYVMYVNGGDLLHERRKTSRHWTKRVSAYRLFSDAAAVIANSEWTATLAHDVMREVGVTTPPPVAATGGGVVTPTSRITSCASVAVHSELAITAAASLNSRYALTRLVQWRDVLRRSCSKSPPFTYITYGT